MLKLLNKDSFQLHYSLKNATKNAGDSNNEKKCSSTEGKGKKSLLGIEIANLDVNELEEP